MLQQEIHHELGCLLKAREFKQSVVWMGEAASPASVLIHGIVPKFGVVVRTPAERGSLLAWGTAKGVRA
ncbi:unnamed protein product [Cochlearia groenlandica]